MRLAKLIDAVPRRGTQSLNRPMTIYEVRYVGITAYPITIGDVGRPEIFLINANALKPVGTMHTQATDVGTVGASVVFEVRAVDRAEASNNLRVPLRLSSWPIVAAASKWFMPRTFSPPVSSA